MPLEVVGPERAALAAASQSGREHEMIDDELAAAAKRIASVTLAARRVEPVGLVDPLPGQIAPRLAQLVALAA